jgi:hypothetical protein
MAELPLAAEASVRGADDLLIPGWLLSGERGTHTRPLDTSLDEPKLDPQGSRGDAVSEGRHDPYAHAWSSRASTSFDFATDL